MDPQIDPDDETRLIYSLSITLLPHQILILPSSLEKRINPAVFGKHAFYGDNDIRLLKICLY
jgi:hypothetical protein